MSWGLCAALLGWAGAAWAAPPKADPPKADAPKADAPKARAAEKTKAKQKNDKDDKPANDEIAPEPEKPKPLVGPGEGSGERKVEPEPPKEAKAEVAKDAGKETKSKEPDPRKAHQKGRPPKKPASTLPKGSTRPAPNGQARRIVAGGATADDLAAGTQDPELSALRDADRVLFPKPLPGARSGFGWDLPEAKNGGPEVVASGLPPDARMRAAPPSITDEVASDAEWLKSLTMPNLPVRLEARVVKYLKFYRDSARGRAIARVWAKKSGRYVASLKAELAKAGLPSDLVWLSLIESGHNPTIISPAGAAGLWQFMPESGRLYGLTVDRWVDERLDPQRSTDAAIRYLADLHRRFGSWELAMAAYNMGYGGLSRAITKFNTNDYWELCRYEAGIPWETTLYVPKIFAIAIVMNNKKAFRISDVAADPPEGFDTVLIESGTSLDQVALAAEVGTKTLEGLNPHYLASRTPPARPGEKAQSFRVKVPRGKGNTTRERINKVWASDSKIEPYLVKQGDSLETIAAARSTNVATLRSINKIRDEEPLGTGTVLLVPRTGSEVAAAPATDDNVVVIPPRNYSYPDRQRVFYRVRAGDTLGQIAQAFKISRSEIETWNALDPTARLQPGMVFQLFVPKNADLSSVRYVAERDARVLVAGTPEFIDYHEAQKGRKRMLVEAKQGDTLGSIGRRYGMSVGWMERVNRFSRSKKLRAGETIVVYAPRATPNPVAGAERLEQSPNVQAPHPSALPPLIEDEAEPSAARD